MIKVRRALAVTAAALGIAAGIAAPADAQQVVNNGSQFTTTTGGQIDAHGGGVVKVGNYYYFLGENRNPDYSFRAVSMYRSTDLRNWEFRNDVLRSSSATELNVANIERPKIIYNESTRKYVMWAHKENGRDYGEARVIVATSDTIDGNYTFLGSFRPLNYDSRDMTLFKDTDGAAYLISAADVNYDLNIYKLSADYTKIDSLVKVLDGFHREAPALMKRNGVYFMVTSGATGWNPNRAAYFTATSMAGPWTGPTYFGHETTYNSQSTFILPVQGSQTTSYLYMGDRWGPPTGQAVNDSTYVWLPLVFPSNTSLDFGATTSQITINTSTGAVTGGSPNTQLVRAQVGHSGLCLNISGQNVNYNGAAIQWTCGNAPNETLERRSFGGYTQYVFQHSGLCLAQADDAATNTNVVQTSCSIGPRSQWTYNGTTVVNRASGSCLDVYNVDRAGGARVTTWTCNGQPNQRWSMIP